MAETHEQVGPGSHLGTARAIQDESRSPEHPVYLLPADAIFVEKLSELTNAELSIGTVSALNLASEVNKDFRFVTGGPRDHLFRV